MPGVYSANLLLSGSQVLAALEELARAFPCQRLEPGAAFQLPSAERYLDWLEPLVEARGLGLWRLGHAEEESLAAVEGRRLGFVVGDARLQLAVNCVVRVAAWTLFDPFHASFALSSAQAVLWTADAACEREMALLSRNLALLDASFNAGKLESAALTGLTASSAFMRLSRLSAQRELDALSPEPARWGRTIVMLRNAESLAPHWREGLAGVEVLTLEGAGLAEAFMSVLSAELQGSALAQLNSLLKVKS